MDRNTDRSTHPPLIQEFRADRELLRPYWELNESVKRLYPAENARVWDEYINEPNILRRANKRKQYAFIINPMVKDRDDARMKLRERRGDIDAALLKWGYGPITFQSAEGLREIHRQTQQPVGATP